MPQDSPYPEQIATGTNLPDVQQYVDTYDADHMNAVRAFIRDMSAALGTNPQGSKSTLVERLAVSLNNDGHLVFPQNTTYVAKSNAPFNSIQSALDSITDAGPSNSYLIIVYPGIYDEHVYLKSYVNIIALDPLCTCITKTVHADDNEIIAKLNIPIISSVGFGLDMNSLDGEIDVFSPIRSNADSAVHAAKGLLTAHNKIWATNDAAFLMDGGECTIFNACVLSTHSHASGYSVKIINGNLSLVCCYLVNSSYASYSIYSDSAQDVHAINSWARFPAHSNINFPITGGFSVDSNINQINW